MEPRAPRLQASSPGKAPPIQPMPLVAVAHRVSWMASCWSCGSDWPASWATRRRRGWARGRRFPWPCAATARVAHSGSACPTSAARAGPPQTRTAPWHCGRTASAGPRAGTPVGLQPSSAGPPLRPLLKTLSTPEHPSPQAAPQAPPPPQDTPPTLGRSSGAASPQPPPSPKAAPQGPLRHQGVSQGFASGRTPPPRPLSCSPRTPYRRAPALPARPSPPLRS